jgi:hypothetical protein
LEELNRAAVELSDVLEETGGTDSTAAVALRDELARLKAAMLRKQIVLREWREARGLQFDGYPARGGAASARDEGEPARWEA